MRKRRFSKNSFSTDEETSFFQKISLSTDEETSFPVFLNGTPKNKKLSGN
jgi:hypothetical protein